MPTAGVTVFAVNAGVVTAAARLSGCGRFCPRCEVFGRGEPGQEALQVRAGQGLAAIAAAGVEVGGEVGQDVEAGHLGGGGDGPDAGGEPGGVPVPGAVGVLPCHDGPAQGSLGRIIILMPISG